MKRKNELLLSRMCLQLGVYVLVLGIPGGLVERTATTGWLPLGKYFVSSLPAVWQYALGLRCIMDHYEWRK